MTSDVVAASEAAETVVVRCTAFAEALRQLSVVTADESAGRVFKAGLGAALPMAVFSVVED